MLLQQCPLPLLKFLCLFGQARGAPQLALSDLLDVNLIGSLNVASMPIPTDKMTTGNTYISQAKSTQPCPSLGQELILGHAFPSEGLNGTVDDLKGH